MNQRYRVAQLATGHIGRRAPGEVILGILSTGDLAAGAPSGPQSGERP